MLNKQVNKSCSFRPFLMNAILAVGFTVIASAAHAQAANPVGVCFTDVRSWQAVRAQLPAMLQTDYIYTAHNTWDLVGGFAIYPQGNQFAIDGRAHQVVAGDIINNGFVTKACVLGNQLKVGLSNGKTETITLDADGVTVLGYTFEVTTYQIYLSTINQVQ